MRQADDVIVRGLHFRCPPICSFRSLPVAPSTKFVPFRMAFFPIRFLMPMIACCRRFSLSSSACSSAFLDCRSRNQKHRAQKSRQTFRSVHENGCAGRRSGGTRVGRSALYRLTEMTAGHETSRFYRLPRFGRQIRPLSVRSVNRCIMVRQSRRDDRLPVLLRLNLFLRLWRRRPRTPDDTSASHAVRPSGPARTMRRRGR